MRLLLDTHIVLWWLLADKQLPLLARKLVSDRGNTIFVSAVSIWEIRLKESLGKLSVPADFELRLNAESFEALPLTAKHAHAAGTLPWHHRDPFDRMLVAQAQVEKLQLLTADGVVGAYGSFVLVC
jgi:PIN domain nuclease of toxin-antitoxin system